MVSYEKGIREKAAKNCTWRSVIYRYVWELLIILKYYLSGYFQSVAFVIFLKFMICCDLFSF